VFPAERTFLDPAWGATVAMRPPTAGALVTDFGDVGAFGPFDHALLHVGAEVFVTALVLGGVLDRHPELRVGVIELGAVWLQSWLDRMDDAARVAHRYGVARFAELPSDIVRRQVRVTPRLGEAIADDERVRDIVVFGSDFPHLEGGKDPIGGFNRALEPLGQTAAEQFYVTNGELLLPE
jgi:predicted TIM-barrel fold metal-dependent hydrolase